MLVHSSEKEIIIPSRFATLTHALMVNEPVLTQLYCEANCIRGSRCKQALRRIHRFISITVIVLIFHRLLSIHSLTNSHMYPQVKMSTYMVDSLDDCAGTGACSRAGTRAERLPVGCLSGSVAPWRTIQAGSVPEILKLDFAGVSQSSVGGRIQV